MSGATTACDVWSFGCTVIELCKCIPSPPSLIRPTHIPIFLPVTGTPPYGNLPPAASLYRIVQDDHPPLPEGITDVLIPSPSHNPSQLHSSVFIDVIISLGTARLAIVVFSKGCGSKDQRSQADAPSMAEGEESGGDQEFG